MLSALERNNSLSRIGSRQAAVFPVPVAAQPQMSRPANATGRTGMLAYSFFYLHYHNERWMSSNYEKQNLQVSIYLKVQTGLANTPWCKRELREMAFKVMGGDLAKRLLGLGVIWLKDSFVLIQPWHKGVFWPDHPNTKESFGQIIPLQ